jgi:hypothetical protein
MTRPVVFLAPCRTCGGDARWCQHGDEAVVHPEDFTVEYVTCDAA